MLYSVKIISWAKQGVAKKENEKYVYITCISHYTFLLSCGLSKSMKHNFATFGLGVSVQYSTVQYSRFQYSSVQFTFYLRSIQRRTSRIQFSKRSKQTNPVSELKKFEPRFKFKPRFKYGWFHLKLYQMFQDLSRRFI